MPDQVSSQEIPEPKVCFVIMPISDPEGYEPSHFKRVYLDIFKPAIEKAGFVPDRGDDNKGSNLIQLEILKRIINAPLAICDLSSRNPNVMFELGIRQAFDKPVVLVKEYGTPEIFDIHPLRYTQYHRARIYHEVLEDQNKIYEAITATIQDPTAINSIVRLMSLTDPAKLPDASEIQNNPLFQILLAEMGDIKAELRYAQNRIISTHRPGKKSSTDGLLILNQLKHANTLLHRMLNNNSFNPEDLNNISEIILNSEKYESLSNLPDGANNLLLENKHLLKVCNEVLDNNSTIGDYVQAKNA